MKRSNEINKRLTFFSDLKSKLIIKGTLVDFIQLSKQNKKTILNEKNNLFHYHLHENDLRI
jgi:hypothetical protein